MADYEQRPTRDSGPNRPRSQAQSSDGGRPKPRTPTDDRHHDPKHAEPGATRTSRASAIRRIADEAAAALELGSDSFRLSLGSDALAETMTRGARGVVDGETVHLDTDRVDPETSDGRYIIGHELVHVAQARVSAASSDLSAVEAEAHELGRAFAAGQLLHRPRHRLQAGVVAADVGAQKHGTPIAGSAHATAETLPDKTTFQVRGEMIVVRRSWFMEGGVDMAAARVRPQGQKLVELFTAWRGSGLLSWITDDDIRTASEHVEITGPIPPMGDFFRLSPPHLSCYMFFGPPPKRDVWWMREGDSMGLVVRTAALDHQRDETINAVGYVMRQRMFDELERAVGMVMLPATKNELMEVDLRVDISLKGQVTTFPRTLMERAFGAARWKAFLAGKPASAGVGAATLARGGHQFSDDVSEPDQIYFLGWIKQITSPVSGHLEGPEDVVDRRAIALLRKIDADKAHRNAIIAELKATHGSGHNLLVTLLETTIAKVDYEQSASETHTTLPKRGAADAKPAEHGPILGTIINRGGLLYVGREAEFFFEGASSLGIQTRIKWIAHPDGSPAEHIGEGFSIYRPEYFKVTFDKVGRYVVHAWVSHEFRGQNHFTTHVEVRTEPQRMQEVEAAAFTGMGDPGAKQEHDFDTSWTNRKFGKDRYAHGFIRHGTLPAQFARLEFQDRTRFLADKLDHIEALIKQYEGRTDYQSRQLLDYAKHYKDSLQTARHELAEDNDPKTKATFFDVRGAYLGQDNGIPDGTLTLVASARRDANGEVAIKLHDYTQLYEPTNYTFSGSDKAFATAIERTFYELAKGYPPGRVSVVVEALDDNLNPTKRTIGFDLDTGTAWKTAKRKVWAPTVKIAVNIAGVATMVFVPGAAPFIFPALAIYNSAEVIASMAEAKAKGVLTGTMVAEGLATIAVNVLPYIGKLKVLAELGGATYYVVDGAMIGTQAVIMTAEGISQVRALRDQQISRIADIESQLAEIQRTNPSDPTRQGLIAERDRLIEQARTQGMATFREIVTSNALILVPGAVMNHINASLAKTSIGELRSQGAFRHEPGVASHYDPEAGQIVGDANRIQPTELDVLTQAYAADGALKQLQLGRLLGAEVTLRRVHKSGKAVAAKDGDRFVVDAPESRKFSDVVKDVWDQRAISPTAPADRPNLAAARGEPTFSVADVVSKSNVAVGRRLESSGEAWTIQARLSDGDRAAVQELGLSGLPRAFDPQTIEWGLGELPDNRGFIIVRGDHGSIDWGQFPDVKPLGHGHGLIRPMRLATGGSDAISFDTLRMGGSLNLLNRTNVFPRVADIAYCANNHLDGYVFPTRYVSKGGRLIGNPSARREPRIELVVVQPELVGHLVGSDHPVYRSELVARAEDAPIWDGEVYAVDGRRQIEFERPSIVERAPGEANRPPAENPPKSAEPSQPKQPKQPAPAHQVDPAAAARTHAFVAELRDELRPAEKPILDELVRGKSPDQVEKLLGIDIDAAIVQIRAKATKAANDQIVARLLAIDPVEGRRLIHEYGDELTDYLRTNPFTSLTDLETTLAKLRKDVKHQVKGLVEGIDLTKPPEGWRFETKESTERDGTKRVHTVVHGPDGAEGEFERAYHPITRELELRMAFIKKNGNDRGLPTMVSKQGNATEMIAGKGTPTVQYVTLYQMKLLGVPIGGASGGGVRKIHLSDIQNVETIIHLHYLRTTIGGDSSDLVEFTASMKYAETTAMQSGYRRSKPPVLTGGQETPISDVLDFQERGNPQRRLDNTAILARYGFDRNTPMLWGFDVDFLVGTP